MPPAITFTIIAHRFLSVDSLTKQSDRDRSMALNQLGLLLDAYWGLAVVFLCMVGYILSSSRFKLALLPMSRCNQIFESNHILKKLYKYFVCLQFLGKSNMHLATVKFYNGNVSKHFFFWWPCKSLFKYNFLGRMLTSIPLR